MQSKQLKPSDERQGEDGDDDGDDDDNDDDADDDDGDDDIDVPQSDDYEHGDTEAAIEDADTSDDSVHQIISYNGEAGDDNSVRCPLAVSCLCLSGVGRCQYQREPLLFPYIL